MIFPRELGRAVRQTIGRVEKAPGTSGRNASFGSRRVPGMGLEGFPNRYPEYRHHPCLRADITAKWYMRTKQCRNAQSKRFHTHCQKCSWVATFKWAGSLACFDVVCSEFGTMGPGAAVSDAFPPVCSG